METFRQFMESALYAPGRGYYHTRTPKSDFYTAPELHPAFAGILAKEIASVFDGLSSSGVPGPYLIVEMGSGDGTLAEAVWKAMRESHPEWTPRASYLLVERCENLLLRSVLSLAQSGAKVMGYTDLGEVPAFSGVLFSNELVDAFPVHLLEKRGGRMMEVYVNQAHHPRERLGKLSTSELEPFAAAILPHLQEGERHAVNLEARGWMRRVAARIVSGKVITVDYGRRLPRETPNPVRAFRRHAVDGDVTARPGLQDITSSVDFEALIREGEACGLRCSSYGTLSRFLMDRGILESLQAASGGSELEDFRERNKIKTLLHPEGMGEIFKVLIQEKTAGGPV